MLSRFSPVAALAFLTPAALVATAQGQVQSVTPYYAFVTVDKSTVRCGDNDRFYKVGELASGDIVVVDGEGNSWSRISYPANLYAFVKVEDVKVEGATATLTTSSKLKAANVTAGFQPSWKSLLDIPLPSGTALKVLEPVKEGESVVGYKVSAPESARAFVETRVLRHATDAEVAAFKAKGAVPALPTAATPIASQPTTPTGPAVTPAPGSPVNAPNGNPGVVPSTTPEKLATDPKASTPVTPVANRPADAAPEAAAGAPKPRAVSSLEALDNRFREVWKQENISAEVGEMMAEFQRALDETPAEQAGRRRVLQSRITALQTRLDLNNRIREQEEAHAKLNASKTEIEKQMEVWERGRVYTIVGELRPSTVYDGKNLPLMYRVVSVGGASAKTLGYLKPTKDVDLTRMLGHVVGVIGDASLDRSLKLNIIAPLKVDVLTSSTNTTTPATAAAPTPAAPTKPPADKTANAEDGDLPSMDK